MNIAELRHRRNETPTEQLYGIEVEVERCRRWDEGALGAWMIKPDGSLRNHGMEFITPPVGYDTAIEMITNLWGQMARFKWQGNARTGIHIHMDMQRLSLDELKQFMVAYLCMEPILFELCGEDREENIYCVPWYRSADDMRYLRRFLETGRLSEVRRTTKYSALYLEPLYRFGTVEFRGAPTFGTSAEMVEFFNLFDRIRRESQTYFSADAILERFENHTMEAIRQFAGRDLARRDHEQLLEDRDSIGVATSLVRTKSSRQDWNFPRYVDREPTLEQREYYRHGGRRARVRIDTGEIDDFLVEEPATARRLRVPVPTPDVRRRPVRVRGRWQPMLNAEDHQRGLVQDLLNNQQGDE